MIKKYLALIGIFLLTTQCAVYKPSYSEPEEERLSTDDLPANKASYTLYLIGDAGKAKSVINKTTLSLLSEQLDTAKGRDGVVFLGDNIYPSGMPDTNETGRKEAEKNLDVQIDAVKPYESDIVFIAGNHDWRLGLDAVKRQKAYLEERLEGQLSYLPEPGCGGPVIKEIKENLVLLLLDSQWWMENWDEFEDINKGCKVQNRDQYLDEIENLFNVYQEKTIVVAMHHPMFTFGSHGGQFTLNQILFPFRELNPNLFIPLPFIGSTLRRNAGVRQDNAYPPFVTLKKEILDRAEGYRNIIFVSGHEHNLQYIYQNGHPFIVSGAGAKQTPGRAGGPALYTSGEGGFSSLKFYDDGSIYALFHNASSREIDYVVQIEGPRDSVNIFNFTEYRDIGDSVTTSILQEDDVTSKYNHLSWGRLHKKKYYEPVRVKVMDINKAFGGLSVVKKSGDSQNPFLRLRDRNNKDYLLKPLKRKASIADGYYKGTRFEDVLSNVYTFAHPYAPLVVPKLSEAINVYYINTSLVYVPKQPGLSIYNSQFGGEMYLLEGSPVDNPATVKEFGTYGNIATTYEMLEKNEADNSAQIDANFFLRNRIFDMIIGDWNRGGTHWRWAEFDSDTSDAKIFRAIPYDREQVFSSFDGLFPQLANKSDPKLRQFQSYGSKISRVKWYNSYARFLDKRILTQLTWEEWQHELNWVQTGLSDSIISESIKQFPSEIYAMKGRKISDKMMQRRDNMTKTMRDYYLMLMHNVDIVGTNLKDRFEITQMGNGSIQVNVYTKHEKDDRYTLRYKRTFIDDETSEIRCYGLDGDDEFIVSGRADDGIKVRIIGGQGIDKTIDSSEVSDFVKKTLVYDSKEGMEIDPGLETVDKRSRQYSRNNYNFKEFHRNYLLLWPTASYNRDRGFSIGGAMDYRIFSFKRLPYAQNHKVSASYSSQTQGVWLEYEGVFNNSIGNMDFLLNFRAQSPQYVVNYFGLGNETVQNLDNPIDFYQTRQEEITIKGGIKYDYAQGGYVSLSPFYQTIEIKNSKDRFIADSDVLTTLNPNIFDRVHFSGVEGKIIYDSRNIKIAPSQGMQFETLLRYSNNLDENQSLGQFKSEISFYQIVNPSGSLVWATKVGYQHVLGNYYFYQSASLGGPNSVRGLRLDRYRGKSAFYNINDFRYKIGAIRNNLVPFDLGFFASIDHGRVWLENENSKRYHVTGGGGIFFIIMDLTTLNFSYQQGAERPQYLFGLNFDF